MNPERKALWLAALRSGDFKQGRSMLKNPEDEYCCLGVACEVYRRETGDGEWTTGNGYSPGFPIFSVNPETARWSSLPDEVADWYDLPNDPSVGRGAEADSLAILNDAGESFERIADRIEKEL